MYTYFSQYSNIVPPFFLFCSHYFFSVYNWILFTPVRMVRSRDLQILTMFF